MAPRAVVAFAVVCLTVPIAASGGLLEARKALSESASMRAWVASQALHADVQRRCDSPSPLGARTDADCTWTVPAARGTIVLVGDSNAGQFTEPVVRAASRAHFDATVATFSSCPFVDAHVVWRMDESTCRRFYTGTLATLLRTRPSLVIIAARTDTYIENTRAVLRSTSGHLTKSPAEKTRLWQQGLRSTLTRLNAAGIPVIVIHPIPPFPHAPQECIALSILTSGCSTTVSRVATDRRLLRARRAESVALGGETLSSSLEFENDLCTAQRCSTGRSGVILYRDGNHLSIAGALTLTNRFYRAIRAHARSTSARTESGAA
jgi:hypothetical protein